jgi:hypothetical protein
LTRRVDAKFHFDERKPEYREFPATYAPVPHLNSNDHS